MAQSMLCSIDDACVHRLVCHNCDICDKDFRDTYILRRHQRTDVKDEEFDSDHFDHLTTTHFCQHGCSSQKCHLCPPDDIEKAQTDGSYDDRFRCDLCDKAFRDSYILRRHKRIHTGEKPFQCNFCEKTFGTKSNLKSHIKSRHSIDPSARQPKRRNDRFKCDTCSKCFRDSYILRRHQVVHTGEKPYNCDLCDKGFATKSNLDSHKRSRHSGLKPYPCGSCGKYFARKEQVTQHQRRKHKSGIMDKLTSEYIWVDQIDDAIHNRAGFFQTSCT